MRILINIFVLITAFVNVTSASDVKSPELYTLPFTKADGLLLVEAQMDDQVGVFIFDTGADGILINSSESADGQDVSFETLTGVVTASEVTVPEITFGDYVFNKVAAFTSDLSALESYLDIQLLGILGVDIFENNVLYIDNKNGLIRVFDSASELADYNFPASMLKVKVEVVNNKFILPLEVGEATYRFLLDSGSSVSMVDLDIIDEESLTRQARSLELYTAGPNSETTSIYQAQEVKLSNLKVRNMQFGVTDFSNLNASLDEPIAGILSIEQLAISAMILDKKNEILYLQFPK